ncbi:MAG: hypothetical protein J1E34_03135 [Oscillospiraceae bacterium]|nr:hypothetical protein [Oscillospiraceae bacterium]
MEGISSVYENSLTGESVPVDKTEGERVSAAAINSSGYLKCRATRVDPDWLKQRSREKPISP